jgi:hypothetical protein
MTITPFTPGIVTFPERSRRSLRSMRYILLTGLLTLVYVALVVLATQLFTFHTPVAVAAATVAGALVFNLPRRRLQRVVNRRYHRPA